MKTTVITVLTLTVLSALPGLVFLVFGIIEYSRPHDYLRDPDPELSYIIPLWFMFLCMIATFIGSSVVAGAYHWFKGWRTRNDVA